MVAIMLSVTGQSRPENWLSIAQSGLSGSGTGGMVAP
jgi:hypothetical protein